MPKVNGVAVDEWPEATVGLARELAKLSREWDRITERKKELSPERTRLIRSLAEADVPHSVIGKIAGTTKGAVTQVIRAERQKADE